MIPTLSRRDWLSVAPAAVASSLIPATAADAQEKPPPEPFRLCLNTSTISGQKLTIVEEIEIAARAGFQAVEPWTRELDEHVKKGGSLKDLGKRIRDHGLTVESSIAFFEWIVDDDDRRKKGLDEARRCMDMVAQIGGKRIAAPPVGATQHADLNLREAAERYRALLEVGAQAGVVPQVELWGFSKSLGRLGECALVAIDSGHSQACILTDVYHLYKGGSGLDGLKLLGVPALQVMHFNDYPKDPPRADITDAQRVYPGDGVAPLTELLRDLRRLGFRLTLSLELFNRDYWQKDALTVARAGLDKMRSVVQASQS